MTLFSRSLLSCALVVRPWMYIVLVSIAALIFVWQLISVLKRKKD